MSLMKNMSEYTKQLPQLKKKICSTEDKICSPHWIQTQYVTGSMLFIQELKFPD